MNKNIPANWIDSSFEPQLFTLIIPVYNRADVIVETLESAKAQTYRPIELIIVDDGSKDNSKEVVEDWLNQNASHFHSAQYYYQENAGVCAARNYALSISKGEYIQYLDSDDLIPAERLSKLAEAFRNKTIEYIETGFEGFVTENGEKKTISEHYGHTISNHLMLLCKGALQPNTLRPAYRRSLINKIGPWNKDMITFQDYEYVIRALTLIPSDAVHSISEILASARRDTGGRMSDIFLTHEGRRLRIYCEQLLVNRLSNMDHIPQEWWTLLKSRLFALAFRTKSEGYHDLYQQMYKVALNIKAPLNNKARLRKFICALPIPLINTYIKLGNSKMKLL